LRVDTAVTGLQGVDRVATEPERNRACSSGVRSRRGTRRRRMCL